MKSISNLSSQAKNWPNGVFLPVPRRKRSDEQTIERAPDKPVIVVSSVTEECEDNVNFDTSRSNSMVCVIL